MGHFLWTFDLSWVETLAASITGDWPERSGWRCGRPQASTIAELAESECPPTAIPIFEPDHWNLQISEVAFKCCMACSCLNVNFPNWELITGLVVSFNSACNQETLDMEAKFMH